MDFSSITGVIMDMDGVLWRGTQPLPGVASFFDFLRERGLAYALASNNSSRTPADYDAKLRQMGIEGVDERQIVTSGTATVDYLRAHYPAGSAVYVVGMDGLRAMIRAAGFQIADAAGVVVAGIDFELTYATLKRATYLIRAGADFIGTNADATFPLPDGLAPGSGSILAALTTATDVTPTVIGKPYPPMFAAALHALGTTAGANFDDRRPAEHRHRGRAAGGASGGARTDRRDQAIRPRRRRYRPRRRLRRSTRADGGVG